jgi:uncharacterized membrane protein
MSLQIPATPETRPHRRIDAIDIARGVALLAMASYHFTWDLEFFGYATPGMTAVGGWKLYARCIASSFLFLVGVSLFLAHAERIRWTGFGRRLALVAGAAGAISLVTWLAVPNGFIFFGILHQIALASLLGLAFLRLPWLLTVLVAAGVIVAPAYLRSAAFDHPAWWWLGLSPVNPRSNDYVPLFPWFGAVLLGIAAARLATVSGLRARLAGLRFGAWSRPLVFAGRHSLAFYLIHQPILIAGIWLFSLVVPPVEEPRETQFVRACQASCQETRDIQFCTRYCGCMLDTLGREQVLDGVFAGNNDPVLRARVEDIAGICTVETDAAMTEGGSQ